MTTPTPFFGSSCWPGARAGASVVEVTPGQPALSIYVDPMEWLLNVPPFPDGDRYMVRFLRQVARSASELANQLDTARTARHAMTEDSAPSWFAGGQGGDD
jgi:hypothetical protein